MSNSFDFVQLSLRYSFYSTADASAYIQFNVLLIWNMYLCIIMQEMRSFKDNELLEGMKCGREDIFADIFHMQWEGLFKEAYYRLKSHSEAQDMVQDIFTDFWQRRHSIQISTSISAYLHGALKHKIIRHFSRSRLHQTVVDHLLLHMQVFEDSILEVIAAGEIQKTLQAAIAQFPDNMREIFMLRTEEFTIAEIAEALNLSQQTVKNNNSQALKRLKHVLTEKHPEISSSLYAALMLFIKS
ncbi:RNA polymerase sigma factor [Sphingobacterium deserti]|uniref:RNA polymerase, sigma-24 subunit, ECF subfamily n=1 Tax=Sphingobacterium deserti TaxID=1229276 RepID=A0A0B8T769_9SPHI|nr:sigma-70 family RNA polymerase sigma factor [Sphingobacterium deserti]KGE14199.1 RNA polymerase, sigma-24 subunit, ECF subfamily [Sphingobacterium deserti]